jgi:hypothetical protein
MFVDKKINKRKIMLKYFSLPNCFAIKWCLVKTLNITPMICVDVCNEMLGEYNLNIL